MATTTIPFRHSKRTLLGSGTPTSSTSYDLNDSVLNYDYLEIIFVKAQTTGAFVNRIIHRDNVSIGNGDAISFTAYNSSSWNFYAEGGFSSNTKFNIATYRCTGWTMSTVYIVGIRNI